MDPRQSRKLWGGCRGSGQQGRVGRSRSCLGQGPRCGWLASGQDKSDSATERLGKGSNMSPQRHLLEMSPQAHGWPPSEPPTCSFGQSHSQRLWAWSLGHRHFWALNVCIAQWGGEMGRPGPPGGGQAGCG